MARTLLRFDFGTRRIGIAVGQEITHTAQGLTTVSNIDHEPDWSAIDKLIKQWQPQLLVIGMPHHLDDRPHELQPLVQSFGDKLKARYHLPIAWIDEKLSSTEAETRIAQSTRSKQRRQDKAEIDKLAAELILQTWLNSNPG
jgi:putative Holliday junction resolvase